MAQKPSIPKGTRDFSPVEVSKRNYITSIMRKHFENFGYQPIETPSFENSDTLMGKYGEEGDRLIFKILNSGDYYSDFFKLKRKLDEIFNNKFYEDLFQQLKLSNRFDDFFSLNINELISDDIKTRLSNFCNERLHHYKFIINDLLIQEKEKKELLDLINNNEYEITNSIIYTLKTINDNCNVKYLSSDLTIKLITKQLTGKISEKALRYDLTVPFARYVVQHQNEIEFPFKRYQIQPVWRADRPQKGRFREFYQCDADVVGSTSLWQEVELIQLYDAVFAELGLNGVTIKINNRKILSGIAEVIGASDKLIDFTVALDKLDKIGEDGVKKEMLEKGISETAIEKVQPLFHFTGTISEKIDQLSALLSSSEEGTKGVAELRFICDTLATLGLQQATLDLDVTLARGLNYYTGAIFEVAAPKEVAMGSIGGGGRYDDLTGIFGLKNMSGVGISFGLDRIYLVLEELNSFPETVTTSTQVLFLNAGDQEALQTMKAITLLRKENIKAEMYPDAAKMDKQFKHAERRNIPFVVKEMEGSQFTLKDIKTGEQVQLNLEQLIEKLQ